MPEAVNRMICSRFPQIRYAFPDTLFKFPLRQPGISCCLPDMAGKLVTGFAGNVSVPVHAAGIDGTGPVLWGVEYPAAGFIASFA